MTLLGALVVNSWIPKSKKNASQVQEAKLKSRIPASQNLATEEAKTPAYKFSKSITIEIDCTRTQEINDVYGAHLRILGKNCNQNSNVLNKSNGFTASVIPVRENIFTTDFMDLSEGENIIQITSQESSGNTVQRHIRINRIPASLE